MKKILFTLLALLTLSTLHASSILYESFEYANHDGQSPNGWVCDDDSWLCGYLDQDHNRTPHTGNWYAYTDGDESWMFMPMFMGSELKYRFSCWTISDGSYTLEFWAGNGASSSAMDQLLLSTTVSGGSYAHVMEYIEQINDNYSHLAIHAIADEGAYRLTIDDVNVDMVEKYDFMATPSNADTVLYPGTEASYHFKVQNLGYEPIDVIISPSYEYFSNIHFSVEGTTCTVFPLEPQEVKEVIATATLHDNVAPGSTCFLDIMLVLDCNCATSMTTLWVTVLDPTGMAEHEIEENAQEVEVFDLTGKKVDPAHLKAGIYIERTVTSQGVSTRKILKQ